MILNCITFTNGSNIFREKLQAATFKQKKDVGLIQKLLQEKQECQAESSNKETRHVAKCSAGPSSQSDDLGDLLMLKPIGESHSRLNTPV